MGMKSKAFGDLVTFTRASGGTSFRPVGRGTLVNQLLWSGDLANAAWQKRGTLALASNYAQGLTRVSGLDAGTAGDVYLLQSGVYTDLGAYTPALMLAQDPACPVGVLSVQNPQTDARGRWQINLALLPTSPTLITKGHPAVTVEVEFSGSGTSGGLHLKKGGGSGTVSVLVGTVGTFLGTVTAQQILDNGGIPLTFTAPDNLLRLDRPGDPIQLFTAPANMPRMDYDPVTGVCRGLLVEEQRTNLFTQSEFANGLADAPTRGGLVTAAALAGYAGAIAFGHDGSTSSYAYKNLVSTAGTTCTLSVIVRMDDGLAPVFANSPSVSPLNTFAIVIAGTAVLPALVGQNADGTYTVCGSLVMPSSGATSAGVVKYAANNARTFKVTGYQLEVGAFPTSYIPTTGAAATRAADIASVNTLSPWYNAAEGTLYADFTHTNTDNTDRVVFSLHSTSWVNNAMHMRNYGSSMTISGYNGATQEVGVGFGLVAPGDKKVAFAYATNNFAGSLNGATPIQDTAGTVPPVTTLMLGSNGTVNQRNGHIRRIQYIPKRLSDAKLQALTA